MALKAGAVAYDITPPLGVALAGSFNARYAVDVDDPLHARAVVLEDERGVAGRVAIVCCDLICMPGETVRSARELIGRAGDVPAERVFIAATHTHTAPSPAGLLGTPRADAYMDALPERIATAVGLAARRLRPARVGWGTGHESGISFNRRFRMRDGTVCMNPGRRNPDAIAPVGPIDPELGVLWLEEDGTPERRERRPIAVVSCFALHYVGTDHSRHVSADYFGQYAGWLRRVYGPDVVPVLLNGTSGDINNSDVRDPQPITGRQQAEHVSGILAGETVRVVERLRPISEVSLGVESVSLSFRRKTVTEPDLEVAARVLAVPEDVPEHEVRQRAGLGESGPFSWVVGQALPPGVLRPYARECQLLAQLPAEQETEIMALHIGAASASGELGCVVVSLPGEVFVELGLAIKARSPFQTTLVASLANDYAGYVPTRRAQEEEGGYETWAARSALPAAGTGEAMVEAAVELLQTLADKGRAA